MESFGAKAMARVPEARGEGVPWTAIVSLLLAALGAAFAVSRGGLDGTDPLTIRARLERGEVVVLERLPARIAARLGLGWSGVPGERLDTNAAAAIVVRSLEPAGEDARVRLAAAGVEVRGDEWVHVETGVSLAAANACAAVAAPRDGELEVALIRPGGLDGDAAAAVAAALAAAPLPTGQRLWLFDGARLVEEPELAMLVKTHAPSDTIVFSTRLRIDARDEVLTAVSHMLVEPKYLGQVMSAVSAAHH